MSGQLQTSAFKKKLYKLSPDKVIDQLTYKAQETKRKQSCIKVTSGSNERNVRNQLAQKLSGSHMGLWLLIPEYLKLGCWDLLQGVFGNNKDPLSSRMALQLVNESALCVNRIRSRGSLCNQGFSLANGLSFLASDESIHHILDHHSMQEYEQMQETLLRLRKINGHYQDGKIIMALDPHRIPSSTKRRMPKKKKRPQDPSKKMLQTFFCNDVVSGQPLGFTTASTGKTCSKATLDLIHLIERAGITEGLILADKEHFTQAICGYFHQHPTLDILIPAPNIQSVTTHFNQLKYQPMWAGYAIGETVFSYKGSDLKYRLIVQREGELIGQYCHKAFITTSNEKAERLITQIYDQRWSIEEFFNFEGAMGWNRASTFNLNIGYGKQSLALLAQAATYQLKSKLPKPYKQWSAATLADKVLTNMEGDIRVKDDKIIITYYKDHEPLGLKNLYTNIDQQLENQGISPKIPWLFNYKLQFKFK